MDKFNPIPTRTGNWAPRLASWSLRLAIVAVAVAVIGLTLARYDLIQKLAGLSALLGGALIAVLALTAGTFGLLAGRKKVNSQRGRALAGMAIGLVYVGFIASRPLATGNAPAIHDVTTDLANPPQFEVLALRPDNLVGVGSIDNWRKAHAAAYGRLHSITLAKSVPDATASATRLARLAGWKIVVSDPALGHLEATATVSYIRFKDDVVVRIVPTADGRQSRVDMRSVSRVGIGDLGVNARRIDDFLKALAAD